MHGIWLRYGMHLMSHISWPWQRQTGCSWFCSGFPLLSRAVPIFYLGSLECMFTISGVQKNEMDQTVHGKLPTYSWKPWSISKRGQPWPWWHRLRNLCHKEGTLFPRPQGTDGDSRHFPLCPHPKGSICYLIPPAADQSWIIWLLNTSCVASARSGEYISLSGDHC